MIHWHVVTSDETASTNADLLAAARAGAPEGTVHTTRHQTAGRGRLDRRWELPAGAGLPVSVLFRPRRPLSDWGWLPLLAGLAVRDTVAAFGLDATVKWPNDVLIDGRKIAGVLSEAAGDAAVVGIGLNTAMSEGQLPVPEATSLAIHGNHADNALVLEELLEMLAKRYDAWNSGGDLTADYRAACDTIGQVVHVASPGGGIEGLAQDVDADGRLIVAGHPVSAGDVTHVRPAGA